ncbi:MAG: hypothetical protein HY043_03425 [Verrucomicrobia bacterium]|nr:hypothetical protein [Verrucomicrobiota bacterium]
MRFLFRWLFRLVVLGVVLVVAALLLKDTAIKALAERRIRNATGLDVRIGRFETSLLTPTVTIENFKLYNSPEFGGGLFLDLPELHFEYEPSSMLSGQLRLKLLRLNLTEINLVENTAGQLNLEKLKTQLEASVPSPAGENDRPPVEFGSIDTLNLSFGKISFTSLKQPGKNWSRDLGVKNEVVKDVKSLADLSGLLLKTALRFWLGGGGATKFLPSDGTRTNRPNPNPTAPTRK